MGEQVLEVDGVRLCVETFGSSLDPAVLLIAGVCSVDGVVGGRLL